MKVYFFYEEGGYNEQIVEKVFASKDAAIDAVIGGRGVWDKHKYESEKEFREYIFNYHINEIDLIS